MIELAAIARALQANLEISAILATNGRNSVLRADHANAIG
jgi:hypothetical protein